MELGKIIGLAVISVTFIVLFRQYWPEYGVLVSLLSGILLLSMVMVAVAPVLEEIQLLADKTGLAGEHTGILVKTLGICFITQIACEACKDAGESSIASKVEMAGKVTIVLLSLPLFQELLKITLRLIAG